MRKISLSLTLLLLVTVLTSCKNDFLAKNEAGFIPIIIIAALTTILGIAVLKKAKLF